MNDYPIMTVHWGTTPRVPCPTCEGHGGHFEGEEWHECERCHGAAYLIEDACARSG